MSIKIDKSVFTPEELETYKALIAKATVDPEAAEEEMRDERPEFPPKKKKRVFEEEVREEDVDTEKADEDVDVDVDTEKACRTRKSADPLLTAAMQRMEKLEKSIAMNEMVEVAKKYAPLGEKEDELAETLYEMKKSNSANYDAYIAVLDKSLDLVEKSGIFTEIGKSGAAYGATYGQATGTVGKVESIASEIQKSDPNLSREAAIAKAWEQNPDLIAEYEAEYSRK